MRVIGRYGCPVSLSDDQILCWFLIMEIQFPVVQALATCPSGAHTIETVGAIPAKQYYDCDSLTSVTIGDSVPSTPLR